MVRGRVVGRDRDGEQAPLESGPDQARVLQIEEEAGRTVVDELDRAVLLGDEQAVRIAGKRGHVRRRVEGPDRIEATAAFLPQTGRAGQARVPK